MYIRVFDSSYYSTPLAQRTYLGQHSALFGPDGAITCILSLTALTLC